MPSSVSWKVPKCMAKVGGGAERLERLHGVLRVHVLLPHEPARLVGSDGQEGHVGDAKFFADEGEVPGQAGIRREEDARASGGSGPEPEAAPERAVARAGGAEGPVLRGGEGGVPGAVAAVDGAGLPPVEFRDALQFCRRGAETGGLPRPVMKCG